MWSTCGEMYPGWCWNERSRSSVFCETKIIIGTGEVIWPLRGYWCVIEGSLVMCISRLWNALTVGKSMRSKYAYIYLVCHQNGILCHHLDCLEGVQKVPKTSKCKTDTALLQSTCDWELFRRFGLKNQTWPYCLAVLPLVRRSGLGTFTLPLITFFLSSNAYLLLTMYPLLSSI